MSASQFPPLVAKQSNKRCSNCSTLMSLYTLPGHYGQSLDIDVCLECNAIWFDQWESTQLSPDGVVALFQLINERGGTASNAGAKLGEGLRCVSCGDGMKLMNDRVKNTRFVYQSCRHGHGRFTTFYNFLAEKQFVRELTQAERTKLCATVKQIKCSSCAAPVDLAKSDACAYCRAPVSVFDRDAAKKAIDHYLQERQKQVPSQPSRDYGYSPQSGQRGWDSWDTLYAADLASDLLWALGRAASRGLTRSVPAGAAGAGAGAVLADTGAGLANVSGGLMDSLNNGTLAAGALGGATNAAPLATATDLLFGESSAIRESNFVADTAAEFLGDAGSAASSAIDVASGAIDAVSDLGGVGDSIGDVASSAGEGVADLVSDGIGSLISSIFS
jgi:hypothetical protein